MRRFELIGLAALLVLGLYLLVGGLLAGGNGRARAASDTIDLLFMSAQSRTAASPDDFCTGDRDPAVHGLGRGIDVYGDNTGSLCTGNVSFTTRLRGWGFGDDSVHHTMGGWASGGVIPGSCDTVLVGLIDVKSGLHGQLVNFHHQRTISGGTQMKFYSAPTWGSQRAYTLGYTTYDNDLGCGWGDYAVHQGTLIGCMSVNGTFTPEDQHDTWDFWSYINVITYTEGMHGCGT